MNVFEKDKFMSSLKTLLLRANVRDGTKTPERRAELLAVAREFNSQRKHIVPFGSGALYNK
ncbi:MAG: hypothetical protein WC856_07955 [Methylococcaceae bacterium]|jgi:hypothetical protein